MRFVVVAGCSFAFAFALGASVGLARASGRDGQRATLAGFREATLANALRTLQLKRSATAGTSGGTYTTASGDTVRIYAADEYLARDSSFNQRWADLLGAAPHGEELGRLTVYFLPLSGVQSYCGANALACYSPDIETIVAPGEDPAPDVPAASILLHEYGHHIAGNRNDDPWAAIDYGPKRWSSDLNVCRGVKDGSLHPGDEEADYRLNPGEAWAETYRVFAERTLGLPSVAWNIVSSSFYPDDAALAAARDDVLNPWVGNTASTVGGSFRGAQKQRRLRIATPHDGSFTVTLRNRTKSMLKTQLVDGSGEAVANSRVATGRGKTMRYSICGQRSVQLRVSRTSTGAGSYSVTISKP